MKLTDSCGAGADRGGVAHTCVALLWQKELGRGRGQAGAPRGRYGGTVVLGYVPVYYCLLRCTTFFRHHSTVAAIAEGEDETL